MPTTKSQVLTAAESVATFFLGTFPEVRDVFLFGSVAREGDGRDIDIALTVPLSMAEAFARSVLVGIPVNEDAYVGAGGKRLAVVMRLLGINESKWDELSQRKQGYRLDIFLFPEGWLENLGPLQAVLPHRDPDFMANIARDALRFNSMAMEFGPSRCVCGQPTTALNSYAVPACADWPGCVTKER